MTVERPDCGTFFFFFFGRGGKDFGVGQAIMLLVETLDENNGLNLGH